VVSTSAYLRGCAGARGAVVGKPSRRGVDILGARGVGDRKSSGGVVWCGV
jgi:hypothetical protein